MEDEEQPVGAVQTVAEVEDLKEQEAMIINEQTTITRVTNLKVSAPPDNRQRADDHQCEDADESDTGWVGPAGHEAKDVGLGCQDPLVVGPGGRIITCGRLC